METKPGRHVREMKAELEPMAKRNAPLTNQTQIHAGTSGQKII
jgi:hypothetical protein